MADGGAKSRFRMGDGSFVNVPEEDLDAFMEMAELHGDKFSPVEADDSDITPETHGLQGDPPGEMTVGEPQVIKSGRAAPGGTSTEDYLKATGQSAGEWDAQQDHVRKLASDPDYVLQQLVKLGGHYLGGAIGAGGTGGFLSSLGRGAVGGAIESAGDDYGARGQLDAQLAERAGKGGGAGATIGGVLGGASSMAGGTANAARRSQMGLTQSDYEEIARQRGLDAARNIGELPDQIGATNQIWPQTRQQLSEAAGGVKNAAGRAEGAALDRAAGEVPADMVNRDNVYEQLMRLEGQANANRGSAGGALAGEYGNLRHRLAQNADVQTPRDLLNLKREYEASAGYGAQDAVASTSDAIGKQANREAAGAARRELNDVMGMASPETNAAYQQNRNLYGQAATVENATRDAAARGLGQGMGSRIGGMGAGAALGGAAGGAIMGPPGAAIGSAMGAGIGAAAGPKIGELGTSLVGNVARTGQGITGTAARAAPGMGAMAAGQGAQQTPAEARRTSSLDASGDKLGQAAEAMLNENPDAFGDYAEQLMDAVDEGNLGATLLKLVQSKPDFRTQIYPQIQARTKQGGF